MRMSEKRREEVYKAFSDPIMDLRVECLKAPPLSTDELDDKLFKLEMEISARLQLALLLETL